MSENSSRRVRRSHLDRHCQSIFLPVSLRTGGETQQQDIYRVLPLTQSCSCSIGCGLFSSFWSVAASAHRVVQLLASSVAVADPVSLGRWVLVMHTGSLVFRVYVAARQVSFGSLREYGVFSRL